MAVTIATISPTQYRYVEADRGQGSSTHGLVVGTRKYMWHNYNNIIEFMYSTASLGILSPLTTTFQQYND